MVKIEEELLHFRSTYNIWSERDADAGHKLALVKKKLSMHDKYTISSVYGNYILESLDLLGHSFTLTKEDRTVAIVNRKWTNIAGVYGAEIDGSEDQAFIIALIIILNQALYSF